MKKNKFNLQLFPNAPKCAQAVILEAAKSNGQDTPMSLNELISYGKAYNAKSGEFVQTQFELIGEGDTLHIEALINGKWENVAVIEEIVVYEIPRMTEDDETCQETNNFY